MLRGQVSLEYMLVMFLLLSVLAVWLAGVVKLSSSVSEVFKSNARRIVVDRLAGAINTVCLEGPGNTVELTVFIPQNTSVSFRDGLNVNGLTRQVYCNVALDYPHQLDGSLRAVVFNDDGLVRVRFEPL